MVNTETFGTFWRKLVRRNDPETSHEAAQSVDTNRMEQIVYETIASFHAGCIADQVLEKLSMFPYSSVTARFSALNRKGLIEYTGQTQKGRSGRNQRVMTISKGDK